MISILIPAYQPDATLLSLVKSLQSVQKQDIVIVNDGSDEDRLGLFASLEEEGCIVLHHPINLHPSFGLDTPVFTPANSTSNAPLPTRQLLTFPSPLQLSASSVS